MSIDLMMPSWHLIVCGPFFLLPSIFPCIRVFSNESALHIRWPKYWSFSISPSNELSGLISLRTECIDLLAVQGALKGLLQHRSLKASILWHSAFFIVQFSHLYMITGEIITFLPRRKHLLISWLQSPSAMILEPQNIKSATVSPSSHSSYSFPLRFIMGY